MVAVAATIPTPLQSPEFLLERPQPLRLRLEARLRVQLPFLLVSSVWLLLPRLARLPALPLLRVCML